MLCQPNGVVLSPDGRVAYITDTGCKHADTSDGGQCTAPNTPRSIYAFDILKSRFAAHNPPCMALELTFVNLS